MTIAINHKDTDTKTSSSSVEMSIHRGDFKIVDQVADEWRQLCSDAANDQPFYHPEWIRAYVRFFVPRATVVLIAARLNGRLRLVLPLIEKLGRYSKVPVRKFISPVGSLSGRFDATYSAGPEGEATLEATWRYLRKLEGWDVLHFLDAFEGSATSRLAAAAQADGLLTVQLPSKPSPKVAIPADPELLKQLPVNERLRRQLRQIRRQLAEKSSSLKLIRVETADPEAINRYFQLEASGWKGQERCAIITRGARSLFEELAEAAARYGYFTLYLLEINGELVAAHFGFTHRACYYSVAVTYNENFRELSPGHLIISEIVRDCAARGVRAYQTLGQDQEWKMRWATETQPMNQHFVFRGQWGNLAYTIGSTLKPTIGQWLPRKSKSA